MSFTSLHSILFSLFLLVLQSGCSSTENKDTLSEFPNLVNARQPSGEKVQSSRLYIDSVRTVNIDGGQKLLIQGSFPDGCTHIGTVQHEVSGDTLALNMEAWREPEMICTQALVPFSFIPEPNNQTLDGVHFVKINGKLFSLH